MFSLIARRASARASTLSRSAAIRWCVSRSAVFGPIPGSLPNSSVSRAIAPWPCVSTVDSPFLFAARQSGQPRRHPRQAHAQRQAEVGGHLARLFRRQLANAVQRLVDRPADHLLQHLAVASLERLVTDRAGHHFLLAVDPHLDHPRAG